MAGEKWRQQRGITRNRQHGNNARACLPGIASGMALALQHGSISLRARTLPHYNTALPLIPYIALRTHRSTQPRTAGRHQTAIEGVKEDQHRVGSIMLQRAGQAKSGGRAGIKIKSEKKIDFCGGIVIKAKNNIVNQRQGISSKIKAAASGISIEKAWRRHRRKSIIIEIKKKKKIEMGSKA